jgi:hypothetical protein
MATVDVRPITDPGGAPLEKVSGDGVADRGRRAGPIPAGFAQRERVLEVQLLWGLPRSPTDDEASGALGPRAH